MHSRWFNGVVVLLWLAMMSWLVMEKVLPPLLVGEPPSYSKIVEAQGHAPPVGWRISCNGRRLGWALSDTKLQPQRPDGDARPGPDQRLPLNETMSGWLGSLSRLIGQPIDGIGDGRAERAQHRLSGAIGEVRFDGAFRSVPGGDFGLWHGRRQSTAIAGSIGECFVSQRSSFCPRKHY